MVRQRSDNDPADDKLAPGKHLQPDPDEGCNAYYTRKQRTTVSDLAGDADAKLVDKDDSFAESRNYPNPDAGPMNYKRWDRYGGR